MSNAAVLGHFGEVILANGRGRAVSAAVAFSIATTRATRRLSMRADRTPATFTACRVRNDGHGSLLRFVERIALRPDLEVIGVEVQFLAPPEPLELLAILRIRFHHLIIQDSKIANRHSGKSIRIAD